MAVVSSFHLTISAIVGVIPYPRNYNPCCQPQFCALSVHCLELSVCDNFCSTFDTLLSLSYLKVSLTSPRPLWLGLLVLNQLRHFFPTASNSIPLQHHYKGQTAKYNFDKITDSTLDFLSTMTTFAGYDFQPQIVPRTPHHPETQLSPKVHPNSAYTASWAPLPRHSIHRWTIEEQAILLVLERWYTSEKPVGQRLLSFRDMRRVFCAYFAETIRFQGENREITDNAIGAQLWEIKNEREYNVAWREVFLETDFLDPFDEWTATREELAATASLLGITLLRRQSEEKDLVLKEISSAAGAKRKRFHHSRPWTNEQEQPEIGKAVISYGLLTPGTPKRVKSGNPNHSPLARKGIKRSGSLPALQQNRQTTAQYGSAVRGLASLSVPKIFPPTSETSPHRKPTKRIKPIRNVADENDILFRFYDNSSQGINSPQAFVAGAFTAYGLHSTFPVVPNLLSEDFLLPAEPHLLRRHEATPFISVYGKYPARLAYGSSADFYRISRACSEQSSSQYRHQRIHRYHRRSRLEQRPQ